MLKSIQEGKIKNDLLYCLNEAPDKNIFYPDFDYIKSQSAHTFEMQFQDIIQILHKQYKDGIRLFVEKAVSDELFNTDISNIEFDDIKWIASSIEFFFEDKNIPTLILCLQEKNKHNQPFANNIIHYSPDKKDDPCLVQMLYSFYDINKKQRYRYFNRYPSQIKTWDKELKKYDGNIRYHLREQYSGKAYDSIINNSYALFTLLIKVLLYVSLPEYKVIPISEKTLRKCGKAGVKGRPKRPLFKTIYLPPIINVTEKQESNKTGKTVKPHFRRGHFRMLRNERYKNQGELIFVRPSMIHGGGTKDKLYVARKISN